MATVLGPRVWGEITSAAAACRNPARVAVAYFGMHGDSMLPLPEGSSIVVDASVPVLAAGATCPTALVRLVRRGVDVYSFGALHAKVYAFDQVAFVGSANASIQSNKKLVEAVVRMTSSKAIAEVRAFVDSLCLTKLTTADLTELNKFYRPPRPPRIVSPGSGQLNYATLLMELTNEQGGGRETQVQPPKAVWYRYFGVTIGRRRLPHLTLETETTHGVQVTRRQVVKHHHNYTIEIAGAELPRPAILQMRRIGRDQYWYRVHRPEDGAFNDLKKLLHTVYNPHWADGRRWIVA